MVSFLLFDINSNCLFAQYCFLPSMRFNNKLLSRKKHNVLVLLMLIIIIKENNNIIACLFSEDYIFSIKY